MIEGLTIEAPFDLKQIDKSDWLTYRFDQIALNISERVEPQETDLEIYVGLEHLDPDSIHIKRWGTPSDVEGTKLKVYPGDVIFGKRRAYQRKAALATFEGICSAHAMVLRPNTEVIEPDLFPFFLHSDAFMHRAVDISVGSLSPTINWKTLALQEFLLPPKEQQGKLAELLWTAEETFESQLNLSSKLNTLKASFQNVKYKRASVKTIGEIATKVGSGKTPLGGDKVYVKEGIPFLRSQNVLNGKLSLEDIAFIPERIHQSMKSTVVQRGDVLLNITGASIGRSAVFEHPELAEANVNQHVCIIRTQEYSPHVLCDYLNSKFGQEQIAVLQTAGNRQGLNFQNLRKLTIPNFSKAELNIIEQQIINIIQKQEEVAKLAATTKSLRIELINQTFN